MPPKKRGIVEAGISEVSSRRRSTRLSSTSKKSTYFETPDDVSDSAEDGHPPPRKATKTAKNSSRSSHTTVQKDEDEDEDEDQYKNDEEVDENETEGDADNDFATPPPPPKAVAAKGKRGRPPKDTPKAQESGKSGSTAKKRGRPSKSEKVASPSAKRKERVAQVADTEDESEEEEKEDDDDGPQVTIIPLPQLRDTGGVKYEDTKIHPNTLHFLEYRRSLKDWESFVETLTDKIIEADETIPELPLKDVIFRIYRDIRFSKDPTPYKPHYSAAWSRTGRKGPYACYYVHIEPGHCFVGGGLWHPEASALAKLRASVDERPHRIRRVLADPEFVRVFLPAATGKREDKILKAFADKNRENALKTKPKGFNPDHRDISLLKLRNYTVGRQIPDKDLCSDNAQEKIMESIRAMVPFVTFLNNVVMPDPGVDSDSDEEEENGTEDTE